MNLLELCKLADAERNKPTYEAILLLRSILAWFQSLPEHFDEELLKQRLPEAVKGEDDLFECSFAEKGYVQLELFNYDISKKIKLSQKELSMFKKFSKLVSTNIYSIFKYLDSNQPTEIYFHFKEDEDDKFWRFYNTIRKILPNLEIDFDYNNNYEEENKHLVCMYVSDKDLILK